MSTKMVNQDGFEYLGMRVRLYLTEQALGMMPTDKEVHETFIASKAPDAPSIAEEVAVIGVDEVVERQMTVFPRMEDGSPFFWDYQVKGFFKDAISMLRRVPKTFSGAMKAHKKTIDGTLFLSERKIPIHVVGDMGDCQRPLRASTPQGDRVALAHSETVPAGSWMEFTIEMWQGDVEDVVIECLNYGRRRGLAQWRNSGVGVFVWDELDENGNIIGGNRTDEGRARMLERRAKKMKKKKASA